MLQVQGETKSSSRSLYKNLQEKWSTIVPNIDYNNLNRFDWKRPEFTPGTLLYNLCEETLQFCKAALARGIFERGDYKYLTQLTALYLGADLGELEFHQPGAHHEARCKSQD